MGRQLGWAETLGWIGAGVDRDAGSGLREIGVLPGARSLRRGALLVLLVRVFTHHDRSLSERLSRC